MQSPRWKTPILSFIEEYCIVFDDEDENKFEYTTIHNVLKIFYLTFDIGIQEDS